MLKATLKRVLTSLPALKFFQRWDALTNNHLTERGMLSQAFAITTLNQVKGDYFEFGVFQGHTFLHAWSMKRLHGAPSAMHFWAFDSFKGLPEVTPREGEIWHTGLYACSEEAFRSIIAAQGMQPGEYTLIPGFFNQSLNEQQHQKMAGRKAAIVYIDCDLYESTVPVLAFVER
jgi:O-methyltransferase